MAKLTKCKTLCKDLILELQEKPRDGYKMYLFVVLLTYNPGTLRSHWLVALLLHHPVEWVPLRSPTLP